MAPCLSLDASVEISYNAVNLADECTVKVDQEV